MVERFLSCLSGSELTLRYARAQELVSELPIRQ